VKKPKQLHYYYQLREEGMFPYSEGQGWKKKKKDRRCWWKRGVIAAKEKRQER